MYRKNTADRSFIRITDIDSLCQPGSNNMFIYSHDIPGEAARAFVRNAREQSRSAVVIIEQDGIKGLPAAEREIRRGRRRGQPLSLIYGVQISVSSSEENDFKGDRKAVLLIPQNHTGFRNICEILTLAYTRYFNETPAIPYCEIENLGNGIICIDSFDTEKYELSEHGLNKLKELISEDPVFPDFRILPHIDRSAETIQESCYSRAHEIYGDPLPEIIRTRLAAETNAIVNNGFSEIFSIAKMMTDKAHSDGFPVGFRGSVGSSLAAFFLDITEVNPLPPHYVCPNCYHFEEPEEQHKYETGWDLPIKRCPCCGSELRRDGYRIPYEVLFGEMMAKEPDIDLNFAPEYCREEFQLLADYFGKGKVIRAGTVCRDRVNGMHPGGVFVLPQSKEIYDYSPLQRPATIPNEKSLVTHIDYHDLDFALLKVDVLEHKSLHYLKRLWELTGIDPKDIQPDSDILSEITKADKCTASYEEYESDVTNEFETDYAKHIIGLVKPCSFADLIRISALMHGTCAWEDNAKLLIENGTAQIRDIISTRDDIMNYLLSLGMDNVEACSIMDRVRKGRPLSNEMISAMKDFGVPDWYIESCGKIRYVFPRAHVVVYAMMQIRLTWYKTHYPEAFAEVTGSGC